MVFHSYQFILGALPLCYAGFLLAHRLGGWTTAFRFLAVASLAFYAQWSLALLVILLVSVLANYAFGNLIMRLSQQRRAAGYALVAAIAANLIALGYFKYTNFLIDIANQVSGAGFSHLTLIVPIGVSFYTFVQIGYLIEAYNGQVERPDLGRYVLFATFLPCVTAGPIVLQREMLDQMRDRQDSAFDTYRLAAGMTMFSLGLFKKVLLADSIAPFADEAFAGVGNGQLISSTAAWLAALCYALQLYFDFSGYSDMAIGLGCIFGLKLPLNFDSPFKATNISDFWRRWHITMTRFFTTYIYTPMAVAGMRRTHAEDSREVSRFLHVAALPAITTFLVAGLWHGAGWTFVVYGLIHGLAIAAYLGWRKLDWLELPAPVGWTLTMAVVVSGLVVFRAPNLSIAGTMLACMWGGCWMPLAANAASFVEMDVKTAASMVIVCGSIVLLMPNTQQILSRYWVSSDSRPANADLAAGLLSWRPSLGGSLAMAFVLGIAAASIGATTTFLYYQF